MILIKDLGIILFFYIFVYIIIFFLDNWVVRKVGFEEERDWEVIGEREVVVCLVLGFVGR